MSGDIGAVKICRQVGNIVQIAGGLEPVSGRLQSALRRLLRYFPLPNVIGHTAFQGTIGNCGEAQDGHHQ